MALKEVASLQGLVAQTLISETPFTGLEKPTSVAPSTQPGPDNRTPATGVSGRTCKQRGPMSDAFSTNERKMSVSEIKASGSEREGDVENTRRRM